MTSHELARKLLEQPDLPVVIKDCEDPVYHSVKDPKLITLHVEDYDIIDNVHIKCDTKVIQCLG